MISRFRYSTGLAALGLSGMLSLTACSRTQSTPGASPGPATTRLEVENRSSSDMDIFVLRGGQRVRLGLAPGNETTRFELTPGQIAGVGTALFEAVPLTGLARPISSDPLMLRAGDTVTLNIPPP